MLGAIAGYGILTLYAVILWVFSTEFISLGGEYKKWAIPSLLMGSALFGCAEILLISKIVDIASADGKRYFYLPAILVTILNIVITRWEMGKYRKFSNKIAVFAISILAIVIGYL